MREDYPFKIRGIKFFGNKKFPPWAPQNDYQTTPDFDAQSASELFNLLPAKSQICYADPDKGTSSELTYVFIRRAGTRFFERSVVRGSMVGSWVEISLDTIVTSFASSRLVKSPLDDFPSFTLQPIPAHQRREIKL